MKTIALISLLHEAPGRGSTARSFRGEPVLAWTLRRLARSNLLDGRCVLFWDDQLEAVARMDSASHACGPRRPLPMLESIAAAQKWADGWRGGLLGTAWFDNGYVGPLVRDAMIASEADAIVLIQPTAGLVDPDLIDALVRHARAGERDFYFTPAAPGLAGVLLKRPLVERLADGNSHPGRILSYLPDAPVLDPVTSDACIDIPLSLSRTTDRFTLDSDRQVHRIEAATLPLNGTLASSGALQLAERLARVPASQTPREVTIELTTRRATRPLFNAASHLPVSRPDMSLDTLQAIVDQLQQIDDVRVSLAGVGDPLVHPLLAQILPRLASVNAVAVETDLVDLSDDLLQCIVRSRVDVLAVHLPALSPQKYEQIMGAPMLTTAIENIKRILAARSALGRGTPVIAPMFTKLAMNLDEMEQWYDTWLRAIGSAVIVGPTSHAGQMPDLGAADMSPPRRSACRRIERRMTILSTGYVVACEQDVLGAHAIGHVAQQPIALMWQQGFGSLRAAHREGGAALPVLCSRCNDWDRP